MPHKLGFAMQHRGVHGGYAPTQDRDEVATKNRTTDRYDRPERGSCPRGRQPFLG